MKRKDNIDIAVLLANARKAKARDKETRLELSPAPVPLDLPFEVLIHVLSPNNFAAAELVKLRHVCRKWCNVIDRIDKFKHEVRRTYTDDMSHLLNEPRGDDSLESTVVLKGFFPIAHLRALHSQWMSQSRSEDSSDYDDPDEMARCDRTSCREFCATLQWGCVEAMTLDLSEYEECALEYQMDEAPLDVTMLQLPREYAQHFPEATSLKSLALCGVNYGFFDGHTVEVLSSRLEQLEIKDNDLFTVQLFLDHQDSRILLQSVKTLIIETKDFTDSRNEFLVALFSTTSETVEDLRLYLKFEEGEHYATADNINADAAVNVHMARLRHLTLAIEAPYDPPLPIRLHAANLKTVFATPPAAAYFRLSSSSIFGENLRQLTINVEAHSILDPILCNCAAAWTNLTELRVDLDDFEADGNLFDMSVLLARLAVNTRVPLEALIISGGKKWNGIGLLELVLSRLVGASDSTSTVPRSLQEVIVLDHEFHPITYDVLKSTVPSFVCEATRNEED